MAAEKRRRYERCTQRRANGESAEIIRPADGVVKLSCMLRGSWSGCPHIATTGPPGPFCTLHTEQLLHLKTTYRVWGAALAYAERTAAGQVSPGAEPDAVRLGPLDGPFGIWRRLRWTNSGREQHHRRKFAAMPEAAMPENDRRAAPRALNSGWQPCHLQRAMTLFTGSDPRHRIRPRAQALRGLSDHEILKQLPQAPEARHLPSQRRHSEGKRCGDHRACRRWLSRTSSAHTCRHPPWRRRRRRRTRCQQPG